MVLNDETIENVSSPYTIENLTPDTTYTAKVVNKDGESNTVTFKTKEITYKEVTLTLDFKNKTAGSVVENPHISKLTNGASLLAPSNSAFTEISTTHYTLISALDDQTSNTSVSTNSYIHQRLFSFNIIEAIERYDSNYFSDRNATTLAEKVAVAKTEITAAEVAVWGFGFGGSSKFMILRAWDSAAWIELGLTRAETVTELSAGLETNYINNDGFIYTLANAPAATTTLASTLNIDYTSLELTFLVEED